MAKRPLIVVFGNRYDHFRKSVLGKVADQYLASVNGADWVLDPRDRDDCIFVKWAVSKPIDPEVRELVGDRKIINDGPFRNDKNNIHKHMKLAFGYSQKIDPLTYEGTGVAKSRANAAHDGKIVDFPQPDADPSKVYEILISTENADGMVRDIRVGVLLGRFTVTYLKYRPMKSRFSNRNAHAKLVNIDDVLTAAEQASILRFCASIGLDYGELDVLRDNSSGKIYIVDANHTPFGPPNRISEAEKEQALKIIAKAFWPDAVKRSQKAGRSLYRRILQRLGSRLIAASRR